MSRSTTDSVIRLRGVRHNNLKGFDLDLPLRKLIVITGLSGSGKSSLAFDTLFAEGQRRYIETFSPYARQFFDRMDKPRVDSIEGIPPAIAIEQRNAVRTTRSTVGTMTEICDYLKVVWPHVAQLHCRGCGQPVRKDTPQSIWEQVNAEWGLRSAERAPAGPSFESASNSDWMLKDALPPAKLPPRGRSLAAAAAKGGRPAALAGDWQGGLMAATSAPSAAGEVLVTFDLPLSEKLSLKESLELISRQGYQRLLVNGEVLRVDEAFSHAAFRPPPPALTVVQDRLRLEPRNRARFIEACEQAYHFGKGKLAVHELAAVPRSALRPARFFSSHLHCAACDIEYREPTPALFSFNNPVGACPACRGFGRIISIDYNLAVPDRRRSLAGGAVKPWQTGQGAECQEDLLKFCKARGVPVNVPFCELPKHQQDWVIEGDEDYGIDDSHRWPCAWYGVKGYFRWLETKAYKMHVRVLLSRYRAYTTCPECGGRRLQPEALLYRLPIHDLRLKIDDWEPKADAAGESSIANHPSSISLAGFHALPLRDALRLVEDLVTRHAGHGNDPIVTALAEVRNRLAFLVEVGLGYLTLDRPTRSLSGGETERVNLTTCLGSGLVNTLHVLDEPSVGLHPRDTERLVRILERLRDAGNTVVVVEHEAGVIRAADQVVDLGPAQGERGGQVVFQGAFKDLCRSRESLTGRYLSGRKRIEVPARRNMDWESRARPNAPSLPHSAAPILRITHASRHNLKDITVEIPLNRFVCVTGVSGSGKTTLVREVLLPLLSSRLEVQSSAPARTEEGDGLEAGAEPDDSAIRNPQSALLEGWEPLGRVLMVDQASLGRTPRSNPAVYVGAFDAIREFFAESEAAKQQGLNASAFSFNSAQGQCERCRGAGFEKIEMQFLSDVFIRCPDCEGRRYRRHILAVKVRNAGYGARSDAKSGNSAVRSPQSAIEWSVADMLEATVDEAMAFLAGFPDSRPARKAVERLRWLQEVGLGYLRLGQPINTLSGGECQRLKLVSHLAESVGNPEAETRNPKESRSPGPYAHPEVGLPSGSGFRGSSLKPTLFLLDEPTTGLHFDDVRVLLGVFQRLVDAGHSVLVIEHNLDVIKCADWVIDLGPEAGDEGGRVVAAGTPEDVAACAQSHTGLALRPLLERAAAVAGV